MGLEMLFLSSFSHRRRIAFTTALLLTGTIAGCSAPTVGGYTLSDALASISAAIMGGDTATSSLSGKDCRTLSTLIRNGASFCNDEVTAAGTDPYLLGFAPVDRRAAADFSLEIARQENAGIDAPRLAFGMISATNLPSYSYNVKMQDGSKPKSEKLAMLQPTTQTLRTSR